MKNPFRYSARFRKALSVMTACLALTAILLPALADAAPRILLTLPEDCNTPDGCTLDSKGNIILSIPNFNNAALKKEGVIQTDSPARMVRIDPSNRLSTWYEFQPGDLHPDTKKVGPMDCAFGPDGNLYLADNQIFYEPKTYSRLLRINVEDGKAVSCDVVVEGFAVANAVIWKGDTVYVSDTVLDKKEDGKLVSGVWAVPMSDWKNGPAKLKPFTADGNNDPRLIAVYETSGRIGFGADGIAFDDDGTLYCSIFEDGIFYRTTFNENGQPSKPELFGKDPKMESADGIVWSSRDKCFFVADMLINAVQKVDLQGKVETLHRNGDTDGADGSLDQPCEVLVRGREMIVVNMDMPWESDLLTNKKIDKPYTVSVIDLD